MIEGVQITPLRQIEDERGKVMHMLREDSPVFERFGEIYFSFTNPNSKNPRGGRRKKWKGRFEAVREGVLGRCAPTLLPAIKV